MINREGFILVSDLLLFMIAVGAYCCGPSSGKIGRENERLFFYVFVAGILFLGMLVVAFSEGITVIGEKSKYPEVIMYGSSPI